MGIFYRTAAKVGKKINHFMGFACI